MTSKIGQGAGGLCCEGALGGGGPLNCPPMPPVPTSPLRTVRPPPRHRRHWAPRLYPCLAFSSGPVASLSRNVVSREARLHPFPAFPYLVGLPSRALHMYANVYLSHGDFGYEYGNFDVAISLKIEYIFWFMLKIKMKIIRAAFSRIR